MKMTLIRQPKETKGDAMLIADGDEFIVSIEYYLGNKR